MEDLSAFSARPRLAALLDHFAEIADGRQGWKVMYPLREVLFLVVCSFAWAIAVWAPRCGRKP